MRALVHLARGEAPDCTTCTGGEKHVRMAFGCDEVPRMFYDVPPERAPALWITCSCGGRDDACTRCRRGSLPLYHCPLRLADGHGDVVRAFRACQHYPLLPSAGGTAEQSSTFMAALGIYHAEEAAVEKKKRDFAEKKAKAEASRGRR